MSELGFSNVVNLVGEVVITHHIITRQWYFDGYILRLIIVEPHSISADPKPR